MASFRRSIVFLVVVIVAVATGVTLEPRVLARSAPVPDVVQLQPGSAVHLATPEFLVTGKRYAFTWSGGGPAQTYMVRAIRPDGWILVDVADETLRPDQYLPGEFPQRWLHVGLAISIQEMRDLP